MTLTVQSVCRGVREYLQLTGQARKFKFSALHDAVSKSLTGVAYSQAVAAERAGKPHSIEICPASAATIAAMYGIDADSFWRAISAGVAKCGFPQWLTIVPATLDQCAGPDRQAFRARTLPARCSR